jgi:hypothetical protein
MGRQRGRQFDEVAKRSLLSSVDDVLLEIHLGRTASDGKERNSSPGHGAAHCLVVGKFAN